MQIKHILSLCYKWANFNFALKIAKSHWKIFIMPSRKLLYISLEIVILPSQNCCINSACNNHAYLWCCVRNLPIYANSSSKIKMPGQRLLFRGTYFNCLIWKLIIFIESTDQHFTKHLTLTWKMCRRVNKIHLLMR